MNIPHSAHTATEPDGWAVDILLARPGHDQPLLNQRITTRDGLLCAPQAEAPNPLGAGRVALPAFANAHDHGRGVPTLSAGIPDGPLEIWLARLGVEPRVQAYMNAACAFANMAEAGIGAVVHCHNTQNGRALLAEAQGVAQAAHDVGIRVAFAVPFAGENALAYGPDSQLAKCFAHPEHFPQLGATRFKRTLEEGLAIVDELAKLESRTFSVQYGPVGPQWVDRKTLETISARSQSTGRRVHMHFFETRLQREWADAHFPEGIVTYFDRIGLLSPRLTLAHCCWLREHELDLLAQRGVLVSCNTSSNFRLSSGFPPITGLLQRNMTFGIGLDGMSLEDDEDILRETRLLRGVAQSLRPGVDGLADKGQFLPQCYDALLRGGREAVVGKDGGGVVQEGAPADFVIVRTDRIMRHKVPDAALPELLLTRLTRQDVDTLVVDGKTVVKNGHCTGVSKPELEHTLDELVGEALARISADKPVVNTNWEDGLRCFYRTGAHRQRTPEQT